MSINSKTPGKRKIGSIIAYDIRNEDCNRIGYSK